MNNSGSGNCGGHIGLTAHIGFSSASRNKRKELDPFVGLRNTAMTVNFLVCLSNRVVKYKQENVPVPVSAAPDRIRTLVQIWPWYQ